MESVFRNKIAFLSYFYARQRHVAYDMSSRGREHLVDLDLESKTNKYT